MACTDNYMQYIEPLTNSSQILEGFFAPTPDQQTQELETKLEPDEKVGTY